MHVSAHLDIDVVALENDDHVQVMLDLTAPAAAGAAPRPPATVQIVVDRSGSMGGPRLEAAAAALTALVDRLGATDVFGVVAFDDTVRVVVPARALTDKAAARRAIAAIIPGGSTDLTAGYLRGLQEARRVVGPAGATVLIVSDGHANHGGCDPDQLAGIARSAGRQGITTTTVGLGPGYNEDLLQRIAEGGAGTHVYAAGIDEAGPALAGEIDGLLSRTVLAASLRVRLEPAVAKAALLNDLPAHVLDGDAVFELGDLWAGETRQVLLTLSVPAIAALGLARVAVLELRYVTLPDLREQVITLPIHVNVVPADVAAGRISDPAVVTEALFLRAQTAKRTAEHALRRGDTGTAAAVFRAAANRLRAHAAAVGGELAAEADLLNERAGRALHGDANHTAKFSTQDRHHKTTKRGRT